jgi:ferrochelatase
MSFGTAATVDDVPAYLASVRGGKPAPDDLVAEFKRRFARVGGSPLTRITTEQAAALESYLNDPRFIVRIGMRHAPPFIADGLRQLVGAGASRVVAVILSPQYSDVIMGGYLRAVDGARQAIGGKLEVRVAGAWHEADDFIEGLTAKLRAALEALEPAQRVTVPVLFTAHSLPRSVADGEPGYIEQLQATASVVAERAGLLPGQWTFAYQSAGHTREEWLTPDIKDLLPGLRAAGHRTVLVAPVQFLADHLEVLYDIDVAAREEADALGVRLVRTEMLNCDPALIRALAAVVTRG